MKTCIRKTAKAGIRCFCRALSLSAKKDRPDAPRRILLMAGGYLGDTFWALQTVPILREAYPEAEIHLAGRPFVRDLARALVPAARIHEVAIASDRTREPCSLGELKKAAHAMRETVRPDLVVDLMCNRYSAWFCFHLGAYSVGMDIADEAAPLYSFLAKHALIPSEHLAYRPRSIARQFLGQPDSGEIRLVPPVPAKEKEEILRQYGLENAENIAMLIPGAGWAAKRWPPEKYHTLAQRLAEAGFAVVVSGSPDEKDLCERVADGIPGAKTICGALSDTISLLPHCRAVAGNDSGVAHLAAAFGVRTVTLFCQTNPAYCGPLGDRSVCLRAACPHSPCPDEHFCCGGPRLTCDAPERMGFSAKQVEQAILGTQAAAER